MPRISKKKLAAAQAQVDESHLTNHIAIVVDASSSMRPLTQGVINLVNSTIKEIREKAISTGQKTTVSLYLFADTVRTVYVAKNPIFIHDFTHSDYNAWGNTALFDALGTAIENFKNFHDTNKPDTSFVVIGITDGQNNLRVKFSCFDVGDLIREANATGRWTFAMNLESNLAVQNFIRNFNLPVENVRAWDATDEGIQETEVRTAGGISDYFRGRSRGHKMSETFYVETDLGKVKPKEIKKVLDDVSAKFSLYEVKAEDSIKEFVETKTRKNYVVGSAYYLLMKTEKVQPNKRVLIMEKNGKAIWGGKEARDLIGLPKKGDAKVTPGNHASYNIFVESRSVNRLLPRGTAVLVEKNCRRNVKPTWDHTAVAQKV